MKLLIVLMCLGLERFLHAGTFLFRFNWFGWYLEKFHKFLGAESASRNYIEIAAVVLPVLIVVGAIYYASCYWLHGAFNFIVGTVILLYCLGPEDLYRQKSDMSQDLFSQANQRIFAVFFWFILLGPVAAVLYRMVALLANVAYANLSKAAETVLAIFNWLPARFFSLIFALVGNFVKAFSYWLDHVATGYSHNDELLENCGRMAQGLEVNTPLTAETTQSAFGLIDRTLIIFIVVAAIFTLGAWL